MPLKEKKSVDDIWPMATKKVLIRVDFNVPMKGASITNDFRIRSSLPTIKRVVDQGGICILMSHLGRPTGVKIADIPKLVGNANPPGYEEAYTLLPVAARLEELLGKHVFFAPDCMAADNEVAQLKPGDVLLLENVRFYADEGSKKEAERMVMAKKLASYGDYYVSDAFGTAHRDSVTMSDIPKVLGHGACGYLMKSEIHYFSKVLGDATKPVVAIVGGAKVSDKILLLNNMLQRINKLVIGGAMAYTFLKAKGFTTGNSKCEDGEDKLKLAADLLATAQTLGVEVYLPVDHICHTEFKETDKPLVTTDENVPDGYMALDIGPKTIQNYVAIVGECRTAIWNGPMGVFEMSSFATGTFSVAKAMADHTQRGTLLSIIGGGDSASAAEKCGEALRMSHVSTGGGASLELLEGKELPGITALDDK